ncbi:MAG: DUF4912 domain-containing protein [Candidatus Omnitrophica bacterium]|nr:DUF4912 domain-containing protein [Candidatus Omnitrophota bacterium]
MNAESSFEKAGKGGSGEKLFTERASGGFSLPDGYGDDRIMLLVRDPWTVFTYWDISGGTEERTKEEISRHGDAVSIKVLRLRQITEEGAYAQKTALQYDLMDDNESRYISLPAPGKRWIAEIGRITPRGRFFPMAVSNIAQTPLHDISPETEEGTEKEMMEIREHFYEQLESIRDAGHPGLSSPGFREHLVRHLGKGLFSEVFRTKELEARAGKNGKSRER